jgi:hypothetical protein
MIGKSGILSHHAASFASPGEDEVLDARMLTKTMILLVVSFSVLPSLAQPAPYIPYYEQQQQYIWNGSSLQPLYGSEGITCDHWAIWYFLDGAPQTPGTQWGMDIGKTSDEVIKQQKENKRIDEDWKKAWTEYHMTWKPSPQTYDNALGPICVSEAAFNTTPEVSQKLDQLTGTASELSSLIKSVRDSINFTNALATPRGNTPIYYDKTSVEDFLDHLSSLPQKLLSIRQTLLSQISPNLEYVTAQITALNKELSDIRVQQDLLAKKYPTPKKSAPVSGCELESSGSGQTNCDATGCDLSTSATSCEGGIEKHTWCITDHHTGQKTCGEGDSPR